MSNTLDIKFVSDIMCPWCVVGLGNLNKALAELGDTVSTDIAFEPFELNPNMPPEGQGFTEHILEKYGISEQQSQENRAMIQARGKELDFDFNFKDESRMRNSFDAHRLLHWAQLKGKQAELKMALFVAHFTNNLDVSNHEVLTKVAEQVGLDENDALQVLTNQEFSEEVRQQQAVWQQSGISSVPTVIINNKYAISGGQPAEVFKQALEEIMTKD
ncbi:DsbA family oxidoreductase [Marinomonas sp. C2222]|uniref:DsbA family oxidoreductase n=1 Tax=Marinomonas sargassi TaxID=2984494 RepID=A0ABT2YPU0_9GAMM|nr:DsbA family oxidoreductase [Marinomonas sargassi]MCV2401902.1 DsbA family oxidoreductase [Marinomonas sargassi]